MNDAHKKIKRTKKSINCTLKVVIDNAIVIRVARIKYGQDGALDPGFKEPNDYCVTFYK